jgi:threonylcarbamoyladenosine tRNA methylthiotransferase MtaB
VAGFHVENFGCRAARADGEAVSERLRATGHSLQQPVEADVVIVNTCSVTAEADREARAYIRHAHRLNPAAKIIVTGCYAQRAPEEMAGLPGVSAVVGNSHKALVPQIAVDLMQAKTETRWVRGTGLSPYGNSDHLDGALSNPAQQMSCSPIGEQPQILRLRPPSADFAQDDGQRFTLQQSIAHESFLVSIQSLLSRSAAHAPIFADDRFAHSFLEEAQVVPGEQTRPNLKIQEGCGNRCTFCVIPQTRGSSRSLPAETVLRQVNGFVAAGGKELVLSGINLGRWGRDLQSESEKVIPTLCRPLARTTKDGAPNPLKSALAWLVRRIFRETELPRLRLSSIEPMDWDGEMIALMAEFGGARLCRHAHLPLQSGSDAVLRRMHRRYRPWHYAQKVTELVRAAGPELTLGADVMVGFPGETAREFEETLELVRALPFGYLHIFPFSPRPGTRGWAMHTESPVPTGAVQERLAALRSLAAMKARAHREQFVRRTLEAITLNTSPDAASRGRIRALTENFLPVEVSGQIPSNRLVQVRVTGLSAEATLEAESDPVVNQGDGNDLQICAPCGHPT